MEHACQLAGIAYNTFGEWMRRGEGTDPDRGKNAEFAIFATEVKEAIAAGEFSSVLRIRQAEKKDWRAAAWMLERRHPERWANSQRVQMEVDKKVDKEMEKIIRAAEKLMPEGSYQDFLVMLAAMDRQLPESETERDRAE